MILKPVASVRASRKAIPDEDISWDQMEIGATLLLRHMRLHKWPELATDALSLFWYKLQNHELRSRPNGQKVLMQYQARVRWEWHAALDRKDEGFNIGLIDGDLLAKISRDVVEAEYYSTLQTVSPSSPSLLASADSASLSSPFIPHVSPSLPCSPLPMPLLPLSRHLAPFPAPHPAPHRTLHLTLHRTAPCTAPHPAPHRTPHRTCVPTLCRCARPFRAPLAREIPAPTPLVPGIHARVRRLGQGPTRLLQPARVPAREISPAARFFSQVQPLRPSRPAPCAWAATATTSPAAMPSSFGTTPLPAAAATKPVAWSIPVVPPCAPTGSSQGAAPAPPTLTATSAQAAETRPIEPKAALEARRLEPRTPYRAEAWLRLLSQAGIVSKYPDLPNSILHGFDAGIRTITSTFAPANSSTIDAHPLEFAAIISKERVRGRHIGPFSQAQVEALVGPFQSSPLSLIPKLGKESFRLVQNLSYPATPSLGTHSINSTIDSDLFPCTWGTFATISLLITRLPPGSQAAIRDVAEAHRTVPVHPSQWPGLVVRLPGVDSFVVDTCSCFGLSSASGNHGHIGDAGCELFRAAGMGPVSKWSDDHFFARIRREYIASYNAQRAQWSAVISANGGRIRTGGRLWYRGAEMPDGLPEEFDEDASFPVLDLSQTSPRSPADAEFSHCLADIDALSQVLGIPWESSKDIPFGTLVPYIGFTWDLVALTVSIPDAKKAKYVAAISSWESRSTHTLADVQRLYGKLLHTCLVIPMGRAFLTNLEAMLALYHHSPFKPRTPPRGTGVDLAWWRLLLSQPIVSRPIPSPQPLLDRAAFSDASSVFGIAVTIGDRWRAWRLVPGWKRDNRDICWAEAIGFEFLVQLLTAEGPPGSHLRAYADNTGVVEGWWSGRNHNPQVNGVFKRIHAVCASRGCTIHTRYVPSGANPADKPSRGVYPPMALLLPPIAVPTELSPFVCDFDAPLLASALSNSAAESDPPPMEPAGQRPARSAAAAAAGPQAAKWHKA